LCHSLPVPLCESSGRETLATFKRMDRQGSG
jgi:hypothetical protein